MHQNFFQSAYARFRAENPHKVGLAKGAGEWKSVTSGKPVKPGFSLPYMNLTLVVLTEDELIAGGDVIPLDQITVAQMRPLGKGELLLQVETRDGHAWRYRGPYQEEWYAQTVLPVENLPPLKRFPIGVILVFLIMAAAIAGLIIGPGSR